MDVMGIVGNYTAQMLQSVKAEAGMSILSKSMSNEAQGVQTLMDGMQAAQVKTAEMSVRPHVGSMFDMRI